MTFRDRVDDVRRELARPLYEDGRLAYELGHMRKARRKLERALSLFPRYTEALLLSGTIEMAAGGIDVAEQHFRRATEIDEYSAEAWYGTGRVHHARAMTSDSALEFSKAQAAFEKAIDNDTRHAGASYRLATIQILQGDLARAEQLLTTAIDSDPRLVGAYYALGQVYAQTERVEDGIELLEQALQQDPEHALCHFGLAVLYMNDEIATLRGVAQHGRSAEHWKEFLRLSKGDPTLAEERETALYYVNRYYHSLVE